jgi:hypothetical protein
VSTAPPLLIWIVLGLLAYCLVTSIMAVLAARVHFEIERHELIIRSKKMRLEYLNSIEDKMAGMVDDSVIIEDDHKSKFMSMADGMATPS